MCIIVIMCVPIRRRTHDNIYKTAVLPAVFFDILLYEVYVEIQTTDKIKIKWVGTAVAAANLLDRYEADYGTIDM